MCVDMNLDEFKNMWATEGKDPYGAVKCLLVAVAETFKEKNPDGKKMWGMVLPKGQLNDQGEPGTTQRLALDQFGRTVKGTSFQGAIATSYLGGTPDNGYEPDYAAGLVPGKQKSIGEKEARIFVQSGGKDLASPVKLKKNKDGYWKIFEYSSLFTGVKPIEDDDF